MQEVLMIPHDSDKGLEIWYNKRKLVEGASVTDIIQVLITFLQF